MQQASDPRYSHDSNLPAGSLAEPGIYVVSHLGPVHVAPHEVIIRRPMILPTVRYAATFDSAASIHYRRILKKATFSPM
jgi:hypothetical protein